MLDKIKHKNLFVFVVEVCFDGTENDERVDNQTFVKMINFSFQGSIIDKIENLAIRRQGRVPLHDLENIFTNKSTLDSKIQLNLSFRLLKAGLNWRKHVEKSLTVVFDLIEDSDSEFEEEERQSVIF